MMSRLREKESPVLAMVEEMQKQGHYHKCFLTSKNFIRKVAISTAPLYWQALFYTSYLFGFRNYARRIAFSRVMTLLEQKRHLGLYKDFLQISGSSIVKALRAISNPANFPIAFFCMQGKDRTGLLSMLIMHITGASEEQIISEYSKSEKLLGSEFLIEYKPKNMPDWIWYDTPAEAMKKTLEWLRESYGSVDGYLNSYGFCAEDREKLRAALKSSQKANL
uniref:Uncharacterized protein n=2 Tax=Palpitomonas bilix TaxID=652834 RepID=A0A7S3GHT9_9EUKA|mmetsp:Transcript_50025/g.128746  ORF Transcript_50025/g.128746 Transcript_50025/m.128746 type:complete len:221 (+) Transcript_50025:319-981(+)